MLYSNRCFNYCKILAAAVVSLLASTLPSAQACCSLYRGSALYDVLPARPLEAMPELTDVDTATLNANLFPPHYPQPYSLNTLSRGYYPAYYPCKRQPNAPPSRAKLLYCYAAWELVNRWPAAETDIAKDPYYAFLYAKTILKGRWPTAETMIASDARSAYLYARDVIQGPWPDGESIISQSARYAFNYASFIVQKPWPAGEKTLSENSRYGYLYARDILGQPWPSLEQQGLGDFAAIYQHEVVQRQPPIEHYTFPAPLDQPSQMHQRQPEIEHLLLYDTTPLAELQFYDMDLPATQYAQHVLNSRWPALEKRLLILNDQRLIANYQIKVANGHWLEGEKHVLISPTTNASLWRNWRGYLHRLPIKLQMQAILRYPITTLVAGIDYLQQYQLNHSWQYSGTFKNTTITFKLIRSDTLRDLKKLFAQLEQQPLAEYEIVYWIQHYQLDQPEKRLAFETALLAFASAHGADQLYLPNNQSLEPLEPMARENVRKIIATYLQHYRYQAWTEAEPYIAQTPFFAADYARSYLQQPWPAAEAAIVQDGFAADEYEQLLQEHKQSWQLQPARLSDHPVMLALYAATIHKNPMPKWEATIAQSPIASYRYARDVLQQRFYAGENQIAKHPELALKYAQNFIEGRFVAAELAISSQAETSLTYAQTVLKQPWTVISPTGSVNVVHQQAVDSIASHPQQALAYAQYVLKQSWEETAQPHSSGQPSAWVTPTLAMKAVTSIASDPETSFMYATEVLDTPFPKGEDTLITRGDLLVAYVKKLNTLRIPRFEQHMLSNQPYEEIIWKTEAPSLQHLTNTRYSDREIASEFAARYRYLEHFNLPNKLDYLSLWPAAKTAGFDCLGPTIWSTVLIHHNMQNWQADTSDADQQQLLSCLQSAFSD